MNISKQHIAIGKKRTGYKINPKSITIHSTANPRSTAQNERNYLTNPSNTNATGWHYVVGDNTIIEAIPPDERAYHAGHGRGNRTSIGIEMVETGDRNKVIDNTIKLVKHLQGRFNIDNNNVVRHYDWTQKNCPRILNYNNWQGWVEFKEKLKEGTMTEQQIRNMIKEEIQKALSPDERFTWADKHYDNLNEIGADINEKNYAHLANRGEVMAIVDKTIQALIKRIGGDI